MASLGNDLAALRKRKDISIEDVKQKTRIPVHILQSIEDGSIFRQINTNTTYTRSYVRSYAKSIGVEESTIVQALDQVQNGTYDGSLIEGEPAPPAEETASEDETNESESEITEEEPVPSETQTKPGRTKQPIQTSREDSTIDLDWVRVGYRAKTKSSRSSYWTGVIIAILLIAIVIAGFYLYDFYYNDTNEIEPTDNTEQTTTPPDSLRQALISNDNQGDSSNPETGELSDTLSISIYAAEDRLNPVRVYTDIAGNLNPFWLQEGETRQFKFVDTLRVRADSLYDDRLLERMQLLFNGHVIQNYFEEYYNPASKMIVLSRSIIEDHPEWHQPVQQPPNR